MDDIQKHDFGRFPIVISTQLHSCPLSNRRPAQLIFHCLTSVPPKLAIYIYTRLFDLFSRRWHYNCWHGRYSDHDILADFPLSFPHNAIEQTTTATNSLYTPPLPSVPLSSIYPTHFQLPPPPPPPPPHTHTHTSNFSLPANIPSICPSLFSPRLIFFFVLITHPPCNEVVGDIIKGCVMSKFGAFGDDLLVCMYHGKLWTFETFRAQYQVNFLIIYPVREITLAWLMKVHVSSPMQNKWSAGNKISHAKDLLNIASNSGGRKWKQIFDYQQWVQKLLRTKRNYRNHTFPI